MSRTPNPIGHLTEDAILTMVRTIRARAKSSRKPVVVSVDRAGNVYAALDDSAYARTSRNHAIGTYTHHIKPDRIAGDLMAVRNAQ